MAKKKVGTDLTKVLVACATKLTPSQYKNLQSVIFALMNGITYGYDDMGPYFLNDSNDIYSIHNKTTQLTSKKKQIIKNKRIINKDNIIHFNSYKRLD